MWAKSPQTALICFGVLAHVLMVRIVTNTRFHGVSKVDDASHTVLPLTS